VGFKLTTLVMISTNCIGSYKSNYHTTTTVPMIRNEYGCDKYKTQLRKCEDTKGVIRSRKAKDRQYNGQRKMTNNDTQNIIQKNKDRATRTHQGSELMCIGMVSSSCFIYGARRVTLATNAVISHEWGNDRIMITTNETYP
jgi:hypothetical protein